MIISIIMIIIIIIIKLADSVVSDTNELHKETQLTRVYGNHTMLIPTPTRGTICSIYELNSSLPVETKTDLIWSDQTRKTQLPALTVVHQIPSFSKSLNSRAISSGYDFIHLLNSLQRPFQPHFLSGSLLWRKMIVISFPRRRVGTPSDYGAE